MEKYQPSFLFQVFLIDFYSRKGIHCKSGVLNTASSHHIYTACATGRNLCALSATILLIC